MTQIFWTMSSGMALLCRRHGNDPVRYRNQHDERVARTMFHLCQICGERPAIRAHLLPQGFIKEIRVEPKSDEKHMIIHNEQEFREKSNTGRFEKDLLCGACDGVLGAYEDSALQLLKRLRHIKIGKKIGSDSRIRSGSYPFRVVKVDEFVKFACGILWKYASISPSYPAYIDIGDYRQTMEEICFRGCAISAGVNVFLERDLFSYCAFDDPNDVYYYSTPSTGSRGGQFTAWFSVSGFIVYVNLNANRASDFAPKRCWMAGKKQCYFNVSMRSVETNRQSIMQSMRTAKPHLARLNSKLVYPGTD